MSDRTDRTDSTAAPATPAPSRWRGVPANERQAERRVLLLDAAYELLGSQGASGTTLRGVCEAARLNPRYFYESFDDLDALLVAVFDRTAVESQAVMVAAVAEVVAAEGADAEALTVMRAAIGSFIHHVTADPRRARVLFVEGVGNEAMGRRRLAALHEMAASFEHDVAVATTGDPSDVDPIVKVAANLLVGGMAELLISWLHGLLDVSIDQLIEDAAALFVATGEAADAIARQRRALRDAPCGSVPS